MSATFAQVSQLELERTLRDLPRLGEMILREPDGCQWWRFEQDGRAYHLRFFPRQPRLLRGIARANPALAEFRRLQRLQKAAVPAPRAAGAMIGFRLDSRIGDALIVEAIEPSARLDEYLSGFAVRGERVPNRKSLAAGIIEVARRLGLGGLRDARLELSRLLIRDDKVYLADARNVRPGELRTRDVLRLGYSCARFATVAELIRGWRDLGGGETPRKLPAPSNQLRELIRGVTRDGPYTAPIELGEWGGVYTTAAPRPLRWSQASQLQIERADWERAWPALRAQMESDSLEVLKRDASSDVLASVLTICGQPVEIVVKRPRRKSLRQRVNEVVFGSRARRSWIKTWKMLLRDVPCELPLLLLERRDGPLRGDALVVYERVPGQTLARVDLDAIDHDARRMLFHRAGRTLRRIEWLGFTHTDAKSSNWIVFPDPHDGPTPILIDVDAVRHYRWSMMGIERLGRAMEQHPQYSPADSLALCRGYAPYARVGPKN
ncbi:MAG: hypothetical protein ACREJC_07470 [Tepidisphaeraceae bacterium]